MNTFFDFLSYHNAIPIAFGILFLGATGAAAATPMVQQAVFSSETSVRSVDTSYIISVDIASFPFDVTITNVEEDDQHYFITYTLRTIDVVQDVWQDVVREETFTVSKDVLGSRDLGLFTAEQIGEVRERERRRLFETQVVEQRRGVSERVVATTYSGLVGQFFPAEETVLPGYTPVIETPPPSSVRGDGTGSSIAIGSDTTPPSVSLIGPSVIRIAVGTVYEDAGVLVFDTEGGEVRVDRFVDDVFVEDITLDTSRVWAYVITYRATDAAGNISEVRREVVVEISPPVLVAPETAVSTDINETDVVE